MGEALRKISGIAACLGALLLAWPGRCALAGPPPCFCNELAAGSDTWRLFLVAKDLGSWRPLPGGGWGELTIHRSSGRFSFAAHSLRPDVPYALVRPTPQSRRVEILAHGRSDRHGELKSAGTWRDWRGKFWLVVEDDLPDAAQSGAPPNGWHPAEYLFESQTL